LPRATTTARIALAFALALACDAAPPDASPPPPAKAPDPAPPPPATPTDVPHFVTSDKVHTTVDGRGDGPYRFTAPWHLAQMKTWEEVLAPLRGKQGLRYLEIGVFEGRSLLWMFEHVLTHPSATATAIDVFAEDYAKTFDDNIAASGLGERVKKLVGPSSAVLRELEAERFDLVYIDGSHTADDVLADAVLAWPLVENGGFVIFDDYEWTGRGKNEGMLPVELRPHLSIDAFVTAYRYEIEVVHRGYQLIVRRVANACAPKDYCSPIGPYQYYWRDHELRKGAETVALSADEQKLLELVIQSRKIGSTTYEFSPQMRAAPEFRALVDRLGLAF
jgi:predicted O-methyltransferase YrrM